MLGNFCGFGLTAMVLAKFMDEFAGLPPELKDAPGDANCGAFISKIVLNFTTDIGAGKGAKGVATLWGKALDRSQ